ncbi:SH3 domain-containing protein [Pseudoduganella sp. FT55W]|uniref:SH3 domain-containing protein n=1 Tax=Duganella rivi TaxID=2666083 RepID=A0A7X4KCV6_9BURK|nr:SH3 domain-containing protein [Duganella rivi]MYM67733.1 SH3 domain-containing protein [Duganella rivi]
MEAVQLHAIAAFAAGLIVTLFLAAYLTPRSWWKRPNARALFITVAGAWGFGSLILYATHAPAAANTHAIATGATAAPDAAARPAGGSTSLAADAIAGKPFRVHRDLNLRAAPGVQAARVIVVPAGAIVTPTGTHDGDWWQIKTVIDGHQETGWSNSLWLRRGDE